MHFCILFEILVPIHCNFKEIMWPVHFFKCFLFVFHGINSYGFGTTWRFWLIIPIPHMTNNKLSFQQEFLFQRYHIEKMQRSYCARLVFWYRLATIGVATWWSGLKGLFSVRAWKIQHSDKFGIKRWPGPCFIETHVREAFCWIETSH